MSDTELIADELSWRRDWDAALAEARASRRVVLIDVGKDP